MNNINRTLLGSIGYSRTSLVSLLILATVTSGMGMGLAIPSVAYAQEGPTLNCANSGGSGGAGGDGGTSTGGEGGVSTGGAGGNDNGNGGDNNSGRGTIGNGGNEDGNGGDALGGNGGDSAANGGQGGEGGKVRQKCVLVSTVVNVNPTIELSSAELEPVAEQIISVMTERVTDRVT
jgi:hypothetical protein